MYPLSLHHLTMIDASPLELIDAAAAGGFEYVGLRIVAASAAENIANLAEAPALEARIAERLASTGVRLLDIEVVWLEAQTDISRLIPLLKVGRRLGARNIIAIPVDTDVARVQSNFNALCDAALALEMHVGLEFLTYCSVGTLSGALDILRNSGRANAQLIVDPLQYFRSGATVEELQGVEKRYLNYMQICDGPAHGPASVDGRRREARTARLLPGEGDFPLHRLLENFSPDIVVSVETPTLRLAGLPFNERAKVIGHTTRRYLAAAANMPRL